jgi:hypothetical protein
MSTFPYKNPISSEQLNGVQSVERSETFGTNFSVLGVGGYMEVFNRTDLIYTIPPSTFGPIEYSGNTIPIQFTKGTGTVFSPDVLTLNSDNISSGRRRLGMLAYVYEDDQVYQFRIDNYESLWSAVTATTAITFYDFGTTINSTTVAGRNFINAWTASTIEDVSGATHSSAVWKKYSTGSGSGSTSANTLYITGTGINSTVRCGVNNTAAGDFGGALAGSGNTSSGNFSFVGGGRNNTSSGCSSTVSGGDNNIAGGQNSFIGGGRGNTAPTGKGICYQTISGGYGNTTSGDASTIVGGCKNIAGGKLSFIGGGSGNTSSGKYSFVGGGVGNTSSGDYSFVGGGGSNTSSNYFSTIGGGTSHTSSGFYSTVGGGRCNTSSSYNSTVSGGYCNTSSSKYSTVGGGHKNNSTGLNSTVGGGVGNTASGDYSTVGGGSANTSSGNTSSVVGGYCNTTSGSYSFIGGGTLNTSSGYYSFIGTGNQNTISGYPSFGPSFSSILNGCLNTISGTSKIGFYSVIIGGYNNVISDTLIGVFGSNIVASCPNTFYTNDFCSCGSIYSSTLSSGQAVCASTNGLLTNYTPSSIRCGVGNSATESFSAALAGTGNTASGLASVVVGGFFNNTNSTYSFVGGGTLNKACTYSSSVVGGFFNTACGSTSFIGGGAQNLTSGTTSTIVGGSFNIAGGNCSFIGGGNVNTITSGGTFSIIGSGIRNTISGNHGSILGGSGNTVTGSFSSAIGCGLNATASCTLYTNNIITGGFSATTISASTVTTSFTTGSVIFQGSGGTLSQSNSNFFWDNTNSRLGVGTATPSAIIHSVGSVTASSAIARGNYLQPTLVAAANSDVLVGLEINPTFTIGAFTGVTAYGLYVRSNIATTPNTSINLGLGSTGSTSEFVLFGGGRNYIGFDSSLGGAVIGAVSTRTISFGLGNSGSATVYGRFHATTGNFTLQNGGAFTDAGYRLDVRGLTRFSAATGTSLTVISSGNSTSAPVFSVQGSQGELFSVTDSLTGSLFSVSDISGLPIMEVFSDSTIVLGDYQAPSLYTTKRVTSITASTGTTIYSFPTSAYTSSFVDYFVSGSTGLRAGNMMAIWSGSTVNFTETSTNDIGVTTPVTFGYTMSGSSAVLQASASTGTWIVESILRGL